MTLRQRLAEAESNLRRDREVIREFYAELTRLKCLPNGVFVWDEDSARRLARGIADMARKTEAAT